MRIIIITVALLLIAPLAFAERIITINEECVYLDELTAPHIPHNKVTCGIAPGENKNFPKEVIQNYLKRAGINAQVLDGVVVKRDGEKLSEKDIISVAEETFSKNYPEYKIVIDQIRMPKELYAEKQSDFSVNVDTSKFGIVYAEVHNGLRKTLVYMYVKAFQEGFVTVDRIKAGESVDGKVRPEMIEITTMRNPLVQSTDGVISSKIIGRGRPLTQELVAEKPALLKGESVRIVYNNGVIKIETSGVIEENAYIGKPVLVRNKESQKLVNTNYVGNGVAMALF